MTLDPATVVRRNTQVLDDEIDGEAVMLSIESGKYYGFDHVATHIWRLIDGPRSVEAICSSLLDRYDVDAETCRADVVAFLGVLIDDGTVEVVTG